MQSKEMKLVEGKELGVLKGVSRLRRRQLHRIVILEECPVCLESSGVRTLIIWDCQHKICRECTRGWTKDQDTCPLCRGKLEERVHVPSRYGEHAETSKNKLLTPPTFSIYPGVPEDLPA